MIKANVDFTVPLQVWDGFGFNYVETCQTPDYETNPQDYGGFSTLSEEKKQEIIKLIFGADGLMPGVMKLFLDPFHQKKPNATAEIIPENYDHQTTTKNMRYFVKEGLHQTRARGEDLSLITTLYGPPAFMTKQKFIRGRDLDPQYEQELANYYVSWADFLVNTEQFPLKYISLHNEGEDYVRWPADGSAGWLDKGHDYNLLWEPEQIVRFIKLVSQTLERHHLKHIGVSCGETTNWLRFAEWGTAKAIAEDYEALARLGLITSHGFVTYGTNRWFADTRSTGIDRIRAKRPELKAWTTSISWDKMDVFFLNRFRNNIYAAKVNAVIPWAGVQWHEKWVNGDPNPGCAIKVDGRGGYTIEDGYYYYKQVCRAGQPGMTVCDVTSNDTEIMLMAFGSNRTIHPNAFVILNLSEESKNIALSITGAADKPFAMYRTSAAGERYCDIGTLTPGNHYLAPPLSATTFFEQKGGSYK